MSIHQSDVDVNRPFLAPHLLERHLNSFTQQLVDHGYTALTVQGYLDAVAHFGTWLKNNCISLAQLNIDVVSSFARHHCCCPGNRKQLLLSDKYIKRVRRFVTYLEQQGVIKLIEPDVTEPASTELISRFTEHLQLRGLACLTIAQYERSMSNVLPWLGHNPQQYDAATIRRLISDAAAKHSLSETKKLTTALRAFLRCLAVEGLCVPNLDCAVPTVAQWSLSSVPRYISAEDVQRVIDSCPIDTPKGVRDRAIILLLSRLGLRARDIVDIRVDDIRWENGTVLVRGKGHREELLPLPQEVGDAILNYIEKVRPEVPVRQLFLCLNAPHRPLSDSSTVSSIVAAALTRTGIPRLPSRGAHVLRHSAATNMLRCGMTLENVSSMMRHRSLDMTAYYAKVDILRLREVAQPWPAAEGHHVK